MLRRFSTHIIMALSVAALGCGLTSAVPDAGAADAGSSSDGGPMADGGGDSPLQADAGVEPPCERTITLPTRVPPRYVFARRGPTSTNVQVTVPIPELSGHPFLPAAMALVFEVPNDTAATIPLACQQPEEWCSNNRVLSSVFNRRDGFERYETYGLTAGAIEVAALANTPENNEVLLTHTRLRFRRVQANPDGGGVDSMFAPDGDCIDVRAGSLSSVAPVGAPCLDTRDCATADVCGAQLTCQHAQCQRDVDCGGTQVCDAVFSFAPKNTCFDGCVPFAVPSGCAANAFCRRRTPTSAAGFCVPLGPAAGSLGAPCTPGVASQCQQGLSCPFTTGTTTCRQTCDHFAAEPGCAPQQRCLPEDVCSAAPSNADRAALDQPCTTQNAPCADNGKRYLGVCRSEIQSPNLPPALRCREVCIPGITACTTGTCQFDREQSACSIF